MRNVLHCLLFIVCVTHTAAGQILYADDSKNLEIENGIYFIEDKSNLQTVEQISTNTNFILLTKKVANFGITSSSIWLKLSVKNLTATPNLILQISQPIIDEIECYTYDSSSTQFNSVNLGEHQAFTLRRYQTSDYLFDLSIPSHHSKIIYLKIKCKENMQIPISIGTSITMFNKSVLNNIAGGVYMGIMLVMILYNLFIYQIFRDKSYILYSLFIILTMLTQTSLQGYTFQLLWPNLPWLAVYSPFLFPSLVSIVGLEFFKYFLRIKERNPKAYSISFYFYIPYTASIILSFVGLYNVSFMIMEITSSIVSLYMLAIAYNIYKKGFSEARFFLIGWSIFLLGVCIYVLKDFGILPYNTFTRYTMHFGSAIEVILLSFALADRINILKKEKEESQASTLAALKENDTLITEQNTVLEGKVEERTVALNKTLNNLKDAQTQLVNSEKMASLGQLTAGIAHEINNPINFVSANVKPLKMDIDDLLKLLQKYETLTPNTETANAFIDIEKFRKEIDIDYIKKEMELLLAGIEDGAKRTADIVAGLKNFSRLDESDVKEANINEGIESTLVLLKSMIPDHVNVITDLGKLPFIECLPGKLNQVFMNLFSNSIYALANNPNKNSTNTLTISTFEINDKIHISIEDTGMGMKPEVRDKIFDPFFTTKNVGEGTGLGMSIVYKIIESHGAKIHVESTFEIGTKITIALNKKINTN